MLSMLPWKFLSISLMRSENFAISIRDSTQRGSWATFRAAIVCQWARSTRLRSISYSRCGTISLVKHRTRRKAEVPHWFWSSPFSSARNAITRRARRSRGSRSGSKTSRRCRRAWQTTPWPWILMVRVCVMKPSKSCCWQPASRRW